MWQRLRGSFSTKPRGTSCAGCSPRDVRGLTGGGAFAPVAPVTLIFVADYARMTKARPEQKELYAGMDAAFVSQNVYLYCASERARNGGSRPGPRAPGPAAAPAARATDRAGPGRRPASRAQRGPARPLGGGHNRSGGGLDVPVLRRDRAAESPPRPFAPRCCLKTHRPSVSPPCPNRSPGGCRI